MELIANLRMVVKEMMYTNIEESEKVIEAMGQMKMNKMN